MRDGGSKDDSQSSLVDSAGDTGRGGRLGGFRGHRLALCAAAFVVLAAGVTIPLVMRGSNDSEDACHQVTSATRALVDDPHAATEFLDPGDGLARIGSARKLLRHNTVCNDGAQVLGRLVDAATGSPAPGRPHSEAQARAAYAVAAAVHGLELPKGLAPGLARMVAEYVVDAGENRGWGGDRFPGPAVSSEEARPDSQGWSRYGRFLAPGEAHAVFGYTDGSPDVEADIESLVSELSKDPEAFAILYDAERANFAHLLERFTDSGGNPDFRPPSRPDNLSKATNGPDRDVQHAADHIGSLMKHRAGYATDGTIPDLAAFDKSVRRHTLGTFRPAEKQLNSRPVMGDIADRPVSGPMEGDLMDGRHQLLRVLDGWARDRGVPARRAAAMKQLTDDAYVRALWLRV
ncbi:hypothetical protein [Streptomyces sp. HB132]|uniref:hypothetical protein n=1 Tax=Streptomyces sp. HB132 TaxID=767388 RepID=UPI001961A408|nr:hypothetical protein [Streptomyces sp. HB132]MBM7443065.1 hypothetical protein [Streptomyces sp. HB132]